MPYVCKLQSGKYHLIKKDSDSVLGTHDTKSACTKQMRAVYANEARGPKNLIFDSFVQKPYNFEDVLLNSDTEIRIAINTRGGSFLDAIEMHNKLRASGKKIIGYVDPFAWSAGAVLVLACDEVYMPENGLLYFHTARFTTSAGEELDRPKIEALNAALVAFEDTLVQTLMGKMKKSEEECRKIIIDGTYFTAQEALNVGIVTEIVPINREVGQFDNTHLPERIVNFLQEKKDMALQDILSRFDVATEEALVNLITGLQGAQPKKPLEVRNSMLGMIRNARNVQLDDLVTKGVQTPAVVAELKLEFCADERIKSDCQLDDENKEFDRIVTALGKNAKVVNFNGKTGDQSPPPGDENDKDADVLERRMKKEKSAA